ncbi:SHOCT domain-containing protein [Companilactobacillus allii]|uniref:SHOCT domain-containing protein n=1 Tax=Companilactobacillus allii TaxID=1847728 RepID=A0A1P8Q233_9LACO|nr:SHOCT domain-containing protein [Companilactobacillus allii]APX71918.1 hypothetical protein BTM29_04815 [Companilactobacillus allii]USQ69010.1 SHOCT domain-containing protein [Companilactobacillus allii]
MQFQKLDPVKSYYRRWSTADYVIIILVALGIVSVFGIPVSIILYAIYRMVESKVYVSDIDNRGDKFWVRKIDWKNYRDTHGKNVFNEYRPQRVVTSQQENEAANANQNNNIDQLSKLKELLDQGVLTQEEFDAKKKELLNL